MRRMAIVTAWISGFLVGTCFGIEIMQQGWLQ